MGGEQSCPEHGVELALRDGPALVRVGFPEELVESLRDHGLAHLLPRRSTSASYCIHIYIYIYIITINVYTNIYIYIYIYIYNVNNNHTNNK